MAEKRSSHLLSAPSSWAMDEIDVASMGEMLVRHRQGRLDTLCAGKEAQLALFPLSKDSQNGNLVSVNQCKTFCKCHDLYCFNCRHRSTMRWQSPFGLAP
jgi:hypothetical protein